MNNNENSIPNYFKEISSVIKLVHIEYLPDSNNIEETKYIITCAEPLSSNKYANIVVITHRYSGVVALEDIAHSGGQLVYYPFKEKKDDD